MTDTKHTPGPWRAETHLKGPKFVTAPNPAGKQWRDVVIAQLAGNHFESSKANARLIAAAPELLAALEAVVQAREDGTFGADGDFGFKMAASAIARAKGGEAMKDDIGSYYDRKDQERKEAFQRLMEHQKTCPVCQYQGQGTSCGERRRIYQAYLDAGDTGD